MRLLAEIILIAALIALAWDKPFHEWIGESVPMLAPQSAPANGARVRRALPATAAAQPSPTISNGSWMWDKNRKAPLDPPSHEHASPHPTP